MAEKSLGDRIKEAELARQEAETAKLKAEHEKLKEETALVRKQLNAKWYSEFFFFALNRQAEGEFNADKHKWQLRLGWAVLSTTFLGACATSKDFRSLEFAYPWLPLIFNGVIFSLFFFYDCHLTHLSGSIRKRVMRLREELKEPPSEPPLGLFLEDMRKEYHELPESWWPKRNHRPWVKLEAAKTNRLDFILFYLFTGLFWIAGWFIKFGVGVSGVN